MQKPHGMDFLGFLFAFKVGAIRFDSGCVFTVCSITVSKNIMQRMVGNIDDVCPAVIVTSGKDL